MLRFAPSPTGDMHMASLRVALLNYIVSKQRKEDFIVRIQDIEKEKNVEGKDKEILDILNLFGIEYSQTIYQSENVRFHTAMALQLMHEKKAFSCFCSLEWLEKKVEEAKVNKIAYKYDDACANLPAELVIDNTSPFTIRVNQPVEKSTLDSFIILKEDKTPTQNFASAVDDMLSDISVVICSQEEVSDTSKQEHIRTALNYDKKIEYTYISEIVGDDDFSVKSLLEEGFLPEAISNYLISINNESPKEIFTVNEAILFLDLTKTSPSPSHFDIDALRHINHEHLFALDAKELSRYVGFADTEIGELAKVYLAEVSTTKELRTKIEAIFAPKEIPQKFTEASVVLVDTIKSAPYFETYDEFKKYLMKNAKLEEEIFSLTLRYILTGAENGPEISDIYKHIKNYIGEIIK